MQTDLFVCLFVCSLVCLFVCLLVWPNVPAMSESRPCVPNYHQNTLTPIWLTNVWNSNTSRVVGEHRPAPLSRKVDTSTNRLSTTLLRLLRPVSNSTKLLTHSSTSRTSSLLFWFLFSRCRSICFWTILGSQGVGRASSMIRPICFSLISFLFIHKENRPLNIWICDDLLAWFLW